jgi:hypothetical protein
MSPQADYIIANGTGAAVRSDLNGQLAAIVSNNSGATEPATMYAYQWWADTTAGLLKLRNSANNAWITLRELDGTLLMEDGTDAAPGLSFASDPDSGIFRGGANELGIATNGVERVEFGTSEVVFNDGGANYDFRIEGDTNTSLFFVDASAEAVGIGTTSADQLLVVSQNAASYNPAIKISNPNTGRWGGKLIFESATGAGVYDAAVIKADGGGGFGGGNLIVETAGSESCRVDGSGRLLIGTASDLAGYNLQVANTSGNGIAAMSYSSTGGDGAYITLYHSKSGTVGTHSTLGVDDDLGIIQFSGSNGTAFWSGASIKAEVDAAISGSEMPGRLVFSTTADGASSPTERARIDSQGFLRCSDTGSYAYGGTAHEINNSASNDIVRFFNSNASPYGIFVKFTAADPNNATNYVFSSEQNTGVNIYRIYSNGTVAARSDARWKTNIETSRNGYLEDLNQLRVVKYNWYNSEENAPKELGLIAQEVEAVFPGLIVTDNQGEENESKSIKTSVLPFMLLKALQEATAKIETLEARLSALESA